MVLVKSNIQGQSLATTTEPCPKSSAPVVSLCLLSIFLRLGIFWSWEESLRVSKFWSRKCTNHGEALPMFTAENWRNFPWLQLVLPICPMTSFFTNFYFFRTPNIALLLGGSIGSFISIIFFVLRVTYLLLEFSGGLFEITFMSSEWIVHNDLRVLLRSLSKFRSRA